MLILKATLLAPPVNSNVSLQRWRVTGQDDCLMDEATKNLIDLIINLIQAGVIIAGVGWAIYRFRAEGTHQPRIEFNIDAQFLGPERDYYAVQIVIHANNKGLRVRRFPSIRILARGIERGHNIEEWKGREPRLFLPDKLIDDAEVVFKENYSHIFVEPGVNQDITYLTRIPAKYRFVSLRAEFRYDDERTHSTERLFDIDAQNAG